MPKKSQNRGKNKLNKTPGDNATSLKFLKGLTRAWREPFKEKSLTLKSHS